KDDNVSYLRNLIKGGEGKRLEFKSSLRWDHNRDRMNRQLQYEIARTIAAFANTDGGILLIGVNNRGEILGVEKDINTLGIKNPIDAILLQVDNIISTKLGTVMTTNCQTKIIEVEDKMVCCLRVNMSSKPVYVKDDDFFIRSAASTRQLKTKEVSSYIKEHWK
ncbi:MAG TPA: ATP-binding protein, partial [Candidatus Krumholzibacteriaceae bacterium]|nr:ATP-binding protein [Candidatus Krumholzibacteriaceae bacterium]